MSVQKNHHRLYFRGETVIYTYTKNAAFLPRTFPRNEGSESKGQRKARARWRNLSGLMERPPEIRALRSCCCAVVVVGGGVDGLAACITCASLFLSLSVSLFLSVFLFHFCEAHLAAVCGGGRVGGMRRRRMMMVMMMRSWGRGVELKQSERRVPLIISYLALICNRGTYGR